MNVLACDEMHGVTSMSGNETVLVKKKCVMKMMNVQMCSDVRLCVCVCLVIHID